MGRHPAHDEIAAEVARWYRESTPEMGYDLIEGRYGWFNRPSSTGRGRGTVRRMLAASDVDALVAEAQALVGGEPLALTCGDRATAATVGPVLERLGFEPATPTVFLAYTGDFARFAQNGPGRPDGLTVDTVPRDGADMPVWATVKQQAFADSEDPPSPEDVDRELAVRRAEMAGQGRALLARLEGEAVAVCGFYEGDDRFIFLLGTRLPHRHRGIARALVGHVIDDAAAAGSRSVVINADEGGRPAALYRAWGFTDEVAWHRTWTRHVGTSS